MFALKFPVDVSCSYQTFASLHFQTLVINERHVTKLSNVWIDAEILHEIQQLTRKYAVLRATAACSTNLSWTERDETGIASERTALNLPHELRQLRVRATAVVDLRHMFLFVLRSDVILFSFRVIFAMVFFHNDVTVLAVVCFLQLSEFFPSFLLQRINALIKNCSSLKIYWHL